MKLTCVEENGIVAAEIEGRIVFGEVDPNQEPIKAHLGGDVYQKKLLLGLSQADYIDSAGIGWLLVCHKRFREAGGTMVIHSVTPMVEQVFKLLRMDRVFNLAANAAGARLLLQGANA
jgi:anti-anti-sigma factor